MPNFFSIEGNNDIDEFQSLLTPGESAHLKDRHTENDNLDAEDFQPWANLDESIFLETRQAEAFNRLREKRRLVEYGGLVHADIIWNTTGKDELRLNSIARLFDSGAITEFPYWKASEGQYVTLTPELTESLTLAFMQHYAHCFMVEVQKMQEIAAMTSVEELDLWLETELDTCW